MLDILKTMDGQAQYYLSLHYQQPTAAQNDHEVGYAGYARVLLSRDTHWMMHEYVVHLGPIDFPGCWCGSDIAEYAGLGTQSFGRGELLMSFKLIPALSIDSRHRPSISLNFDIKSLVSR